MRVSCLFVSVAIMLAGEIQSLPVLGLGNLPVLGNEGQLLNSVSKTLRPVPLAGNLAGDLLHNSDDGVVLSEIGLAGEGGLINSEGSLGGIVGSLQRRQALPLIGDLGGLTNGVENLPVLGSLGSALPVTQALTSKLGSLDGDLPDVNHLGFGLHKVLPIHGLSGGFPSILKRDGANNAFGSIPLVGSLPGASSIPFMNSVPSFSSLPLINSIPSFSSLPLISSVPQLSSLPLISSVPGISQLSSGFPGPASLGKLL